MNKRIDFSNNGGFPATQYTTDYMQSSYREAFMAMAGLIGDKVILSGAVITGAVVTNGWLSINGELVPFIGGPYAVGDGVVIVETSETRLFQNNSTYSVYFKREARIGTPALFLFTDLKSRGALFPTPGEIKMWSGLVAKIPSGYGLADGSLKNVADYPELFANLSNVFGGDGVTTFSLPNLKGKFIVGYDAGDADYNSIGNTGGEKAHILTKVELPNIQLKSGIYLNSNDYVDGSASPNNIGPNVTANPVYTEALGNGIGHENRPPFYTLAYLIKL